MCHAILFEDMERKTLKLHLGSNIVTAGGTGLIFWEKEDAVGPIAGFAFIG